MSDRAITYYVDNEPQTTTTDDLTVRQILAKSGNDPATHYLVELQGHHQVPYKNLDQELKVHEDEKFAAIFTGPTPVSCE